MRLLLIVFATLLSLLPGLAQAQGLEDPRNAAKVFVEATATGDADAIANLYAPNALILAMVPTLLSGTDLSTAQKNVEAAVAARKSAGDSNVYSYFMSVTMDGWGCDWHPSAKTHAAMGASLTQELKTRLGW